MKIPSSLDRRRGNPLEVQMTPMIDMVFLLIVFFVWTSGGQVVERLLPSRLSDQTGTAPTPSTDDVPPPEADFEPVVVRLAIGGEGTVWQVNDQPIESLAAVQAVLEKLAAIKSDAPVIVHPDPEIPLADVIDAYDLSRRVGFEKIQFAAASK